MSKNFVREINNIDDITKQSYLTNKANDLLSTKKHNYIRKETNDYHCLTDNLKTLTSTNTSLLSVTNNNGTTNKAVLHPKHDATKEQVLESTNKTINITHATNDSEEKTNVETNPQKVLEHDNLEVFNGLVKTHMDNENTTTLEVDFSMVQPRLGANYGAFIDNNLITGHYATDVINMFDLNDLQNGVVTGYQLDNAPTKDSYIIEAYSRGDYTMQKAYSFKAEDNEPHKEFVRYHYNSSWTEWKELSVTFL